MINTTILILIITIALVILINWGWHKLSIRLMPWLMKKQFEKVLELQQLELERQIKEQIEKESAKEVKQSENNNNK